ncbi:MAG: flagellar basal body rod C-terminal domain-containing protein [Pseudomonadota bacterium]|nr:flagellar basal body rod C-terminal domain-containing protein [Pseudomonadota bacterium]
MFSNNRSAVAATGFLSGGAVAVIPANTANLDIFSLSGQSTASFALSPESLADIDDITLTIRSLDANDQTVDKIVDFNVAFADIKGFEGSWLDFDQIADLMNVGTITGVVRGSGESVSLASLGGFVSGSEGNLTFSLTENDFSAATASISGGRIVDGAVTAGVAAESDVQIFTREGRHVAGTLQTDTSRAALQAMMTEDNGFNTGAVYVGDYLNLSGEGAYLGIETTATYDTEVLVTSEQTSGQTRVTFAALEGIDTNESSIDGLGASAATIGYSMSVGPLSASIDAADIDGPGADDVAEAMLRELRNTAPIATLAGLPDASPLANDSVRLRFEDDVYTVTMTDGEPLVSGGEAGRLNAFFDAEKRLNIVSTAGSISRSSIAVLADAGDEANVAAARRLGLMYQEQHIPTRFSGEITSIDGTTAPDTDTVVTLNFDRDDTYNLGFVFNGKPDFGPGSTTDMAFSLSNLAMTGGDASAIAAAINAAVADNATAGDGGADMTSLVSATSYGNLVTLRLKDGLGVEIQSVNGAVSHGDGEVDIRAFTETTASFGAATAALQIDEGRIHAFKVNGSAITIDTTVDGLRMATGGTLDGAIADAVAAISAAIDSKSGAGMAAVDTSLSVTGTSILFDMTDASGNPIVVSEVQNLTRAAQTAGSLVINQDVTNSNPVVVSHGEYLTDDGQSSGTPLAIAAGNTATLSFSNSSQVYQFTLDADGNGNIGADETFTLDAVNEGFQAAIERLTLEISTAGGSEVATILDGEKIRITNNRTDGVSLTFGTANTMQSDVIAEVTAGTLHFRPEAASDDTLQDEANTVQLATGDIGISEGGRLASLADSSAALQFEEGRIYRFLVNGHQIDIDTTPAGLRAATNGDLAGAISDAEAALRTAIDVTSGLGTSTVSSASSVTGATIRMDLTDATGNPIVISDFQQVTREAISAGSLSILQDITANSTIQVAHGEFLTTDGQSGSTALAIADGTTGSIAFSQQTQRFSFTLDADDDGAIGASETYVIDGVKADFATQLAAVATQINSVSGLAATVVDNALQITNTRGDGTSLSFGTADAMASDALDAVATGAAYFKSSLPAGAALDLDSTAISLSTGGSAMSSDGMLANAAGVSGLVDGYTVPDFDLSRDGNQIIVVPDDGADMPNVTTDAISLAKQRYTLSNLPGEDLIMIVGDTGARRLSVQYDMLPEAVLQPQRDIDIRVTDIDVGEITYFDVETGTSLATRRLDEDQKATALDFAVGFTGKLAANDKFLISGNRDGIGDNRNIEQLLQLQSRDLMGTGSGGFQKVFSATVAKLGAVVQSGNIAADAAIALRDASLEAESEYTGVNLDTEAANLIEQQQAYQASARILATARELFDTLIQSV